MKIFIFTIAAFLTLIGQETLASAVSDSGCIATGNLQTNDSFLITEISCKILHSVSISAGDTVVLTNDEYMTLVAKIGSSTDFTVPIMNFAGSRGADGQIYGGPYLYSYESSAALPVVGTTTSSSDSTELEKRSLQLQLIELLRTLISFFR